MVRKALIKDVHDIFALVEGFAKHGEIMQRPLSELYANIRDFLVFEASGEVIGTCALHVCWEDLGEIRSLAVKEDAEGKGVGSALVAACLEEARGLGLKKIFALTYKVPFFERLNFKAVSKDVLPHKVWRECIDCVKFPDCDENAVMIELK